jgi:RND family efflux transporter MFP subunit
VVTVTSGTIESVIEISGNLAAETRVDVRPTLPGTLDSVKVHLGDRVSPGAVLATMDRRELDAHVDAATAAVAVAHASVEAAEAALQNASQELDRARSLYEKGGIAKQRLDAAATQARSTQAQRDLAAANVAQADAALRRAREAQRDATLRAPMAGLVVARNFDAGSVVGPGNDKPVVAVADMRTLKLEAGVSELEAGRLKIGAPVKVTLSARPGDTFEGRVSALSPEVDPKDRHFRVEIRVNNQSEALLGGMYATARIVVGRADGLIAPREAVADRNGSRVVYRIDGDTVRVVRVAEGLSDGSKVALLSGLNSGDLVVSDARHDVTDGAHVRPIKAN